MRDRLIRGAGLAAAGFLVSRVLTFAAYAVIASQITPKEAGAFAAGTILIGIATLFAESGLLAALISWRGDVEEAASTAFVATVGTGLLLAGLATASGPLVGAVFQDDLAGDIALASGGVLLLKALAVVPEALLQRRFSFARRVVIDPLGALAFGVVAVVACANGAGAWGLVYGTYATFAVSLVAAWGFARWRPRASRLSWSVWRRLAGFGRHIVVSEIVRTLADRVDALLLGRLAGAGPLGQYTYGQRIANQPPGAFISVGAYVLFPALARVAEEPERLKDAFVESVRTLALIVFPASLILLPTGDQLAFAAFGPQWDGAGHVVQAMCLITIGFTWASVASETLKAAHRPQQISGIHLVSLVANLVLMPALLWADETGVAAALSISAMLSGLYALRLAARAAGTTLREPLAASAGAATSAVAGLLAAGALDLTVFAGDTGRLLSLGEAVAETAVLGVVFWLVLRVVSPQDRDRLAGLAATVLRRGKAAAA